MQKFLLFIISLKSKQLKCKCLHSSSKPIKKLVLYFTFYSLFEFISSTTISVILVPLVLSCLETIKFKNSRLHFKKSAAFYHKLPDLLKKSSAGHNTIETII